MQPDNLLLAALGTALLNALALLALVVLVVAALEVASRARRRYQEWRRERRLPHAAMRLSPEALHTSVERARAGGVSSEEVAVAMRLSARRGVGGRGWPRA